MFVGFRYYSGPSRVFCWVIDFSSPIKPAQWDRTSRIEIQLFDIPFALFDVALVCLGLQKLLSYKFGSCCKWVQDYFVSKKKNIYREREREYGVFIVSYDISWSFIDHSKTSFPPFPPPKKTRWQTLVWRASSVKVSALALVLLISDSTAWIAYESHWWNITWYLVARIPRISTDDFRNQRFVLWLTDKGILKHRKNHIVSVSSSLTAWQMGCHIQSWWTKSWLHYPIYSILTILTGAGPYAWTVSNHLASEIPNWFLCENPVWLIGQHIPTKQALLFIVTCTNESVSHVPGPLLDLLHEPSFPQCDLKPLVLAIPFCRWCFSSRHGKDLYSSCLTGISRMTYSIAIMTYFHSFPRSGSSSKLQKKSVLPLQSDLHVRLVYTIYLQHTRWEVL